MNYIASNIIAIGTAALVGLTVGAVWHAGLRAAAFLTTRPGGPALIVTAAVAEAWLTAILAGALILAPAAGPGPWVMALASAVVIWIGFVLPTVIVTGLHAGLSVGATLGYAAHWLAVMVAQAATLQVIGLAKPG